MNSKKIIYFVVLLLLISFISNKSKEEWKTRVIYQLLTDRFHNNNSGGGNCNLSTYCGGTFNGITNHLDYIQGLGFNAIWISPIIENTPNGYHGYHLKNLYNINPYFGTESDLIRLVEECHKRDIWVMLDVVANHVGLVGTDYSQVVPFNKAEHYHDLCQINQEDFDTNQWKVEVNNLT